MMMMIVSVRMRANVMVMVMNVMRGDEGRVGVDLVCFTRHVMIVRMRVRM